MVYWATIDLVSNVTSSRSIIYEKSCAIAFVSIFLFCVTDFVKTAYLVHVINLLNPNGYHTYHLL
jgi:hypothetical protein